MSMPQIPKGFRDFLPQKMAVRRRIIETMTRIFETFGFEPLDTPCLEYAETLEGKYGEEGEKLIYKFQDRGGRNVALRYDLTIPLSRVIAMHTDITKPFKRYQIAPVWRADKPQKGRFREFYQCDIDIIGSQSAYADGELLVITHSVLRTLGFENFIIRINNRKVLNALALKAGIAEKDIAAFLRCLDKLDKVGADAVLSEMQDKGLLSPRSSDLVYKTVLKDGGDFNEIAQLLQGIPVGDDGLKELEMIRETLVSHDVPEKFYRFDISLARGLDYYTGPIFETVVTEPKIGSITGGGRYDNLIGLFTKQTIPATGTSFGLERLVTVMEELDSLKTAPTQTRVLVTFFDETLMAENLRVAKKLRDEAINTEVYFAPVKLKKQLAYAANRSIPLVVIVGPDEAKQGMVTLRDMRRGSQETIPLPELIRTVKDDSVS